MELCKLSVDCKDNMVTWYVYWLTFSFGSWIAWEFKIFEYDTVSSSSIKLQIIFV